MSNPGIPEGYIRRNIACPVCTEDHLWQKVYYPQLWCNTCKKIVGLLGAKARAPQHSASDTPTVQYRYDNY